MEQKKKMKDRQKKPGETEQKHKAAMGQKKMKDRQKKPGEKEQNHMVAVNAHKAHKQRVEMWRKLLTGRSRIVNGCGGRVLSANELASMWLSFLNCQAELARMTVSMAEILLMLERGETPEFGNLSPRALTRAELVAIGDWYDSEVEHRSVLDAFVGAQIGKRAPNYTFNEKHILAAAQTCEPCTQCGMLRTSAHFWPLDWRHRTTKDASIKCEECCPKPPDELTGYLPEDARRAEISIRRAEISIRAAALPIMCKACERSLPRSQFRTDKRGKFDFR